MTPTQRTLAEARKIGFSAHVVERWNPHAHIRQDMAGCIDILAWKAGVGTIGIQATSDSNHAARATKVRTLLGERDDLREWLAAGNRLEIWSFGKRGERGRRKLWTLRREEITVTPDPGKPGAREERGA